MAHSILDRPTEETSSVTTGGDPAAHDLAAVVTTLLCGAESPPMPEWTYTTWYRALAYPELGPRAQAMTKRLGERRDEVLSHEALRSLVEWAGSRRRDDPLAGAAAALATVQSPELRVHGGRADLSELARRVAVAVDTARPLRASPPYRRHVPLTDLDRFPAAEDEAPLAENPRLAGAVAALVRLTGADAGSELTRDVETAVVQAGDWWTRHPAPVPSAIGGPALPGVLLAQNLRPADRLSAQVSDLRLLHLVAGPQPGRARPCQVAWRRGLTFWVAVRLSPLGGTWSPPPDTVHWWRTQLEVLAAD
jgi:hypothetical protein